MKNFGQYQKNNHGNIEIIFWNGVKKILFANGNIFVISNWKKGPKKLRAPKGQKSLILSKETPKEPSKEPSKESSKEPSKEPSKELSKEPYKKPSKEP